jgi:hypothetical protein
MPLLNRTERFLEPAQLEAMRNAALAHPAMAAQLLNPTAFSRSRRFVISFNRAGAARLRDPSGDYHFLLPFFDAAAEPESNAFVMNVLAIPPAERADGSPAVALHFDDTVRVDSARLFLAHSVSVFYLQVPANVDGGQLELYNARGDGALAERASAGMPPNAVVGPSPNTLVVFRGDALHRVSAMHEASAGDEATSGASARRMRVRVVLEQYRVPDEAVRRPMFDPTGRAEYRSPSTRSLSKLAHLYGSASRWAVRGLVVAWVVSAAASARGGAARG